MAVDEQSKLPAGHFAEPGEFMGLIAAVAAPPGVAATEDAMQKLKVAGFETIGMADDFCGYKELLSL